MSKKLDVLRKLRNSEEILDRLYASLEEVDEKVFISERFDDCMEQMLSIILSELAILRQSIKKIEQEVIQEMKNANSN